MPKDRDGRLRYMNPAGLAVIGRTDAEYMADRDQGEALMRNDARIMNSGCHSGHPRVAPTVE